MARGRVPGGPPVNDYPLWLAVVEISTMDPHEQVQSFIIAAPDAIAAEARLYAYLSPRTPRVLKLGELLDDIARIWAHGEAVPWDGTIIE